MNISLWILQVLLALHTVMGAVWKFSNSEQSVPSLGALPHPVWLGLSVLEFLCAAGLVAPALSPPLAVLVPLAAGVIALEMALFCVVHLSSGAEQHGQLIYWLVVAALSAFVAYGRFVVKPV